MARRGLGAWAALRHWPRVEPRRLIRRLTGSSGRSGAAIGFFPRFTRSRPRRTMGRRASGSGSPADAAPLATAPLNGALPPF